MDSTTVGKTNSLVSPFLKSDLVVQTQQTPGVVLFENYEQLKRHISEGVAYYSGFEYSFDTYQIAVRHHEELKYVKNILQKTKKEIVKSYNEPLEIVEARIDELIDLIKAPFKKVETFIKENEKNVRKYEIYIFAEELARQQGLQNHTESVIRSSAFFDLKWLNASCSTAKWRAAVSEKIKNAVRDIMDIEAMQYENEPSAMAYYYQTLSIDKVKEFMLSLQSASKLTEKSNTVIASETAETESKLPQDESDSAYIPMDPKGAGLKDSEILTCVANSVNPYTGEIIAGIDDCLKAKLYEISAKMEELTDVILWRTARETRRAAFKKQRAEKFQRIGERWTEEEEKQLVEEFKQGLAIPDIAQIHNRKKGGIEARLKKLGLLE